MDGSGGNVRIVGRAAGVVASVVLLAGCGVFGGEETPADDPPAAAGGSGGSAGSAGAGPGDARVAENDLTTTVAKQTVKLPKQPENSVEFGVQSLTVRGKVMELRMLLTPRFSAGGEEDVSPYEMNGKNSPRPTLLDRENLKRYSVVTEEGPVRVRKWETEPVLVSTKNNTTMAATYVFAAPEDSIDKVDVEFTDWAPPFLDVPITR